MAHSAKQARSKKETDAEVESLKEALSITTQLLYEWTRKGDPEIVLQQVRSLRERIQQIESDAAIAAEKVERLLAHKRRLQKRLASIQYASEIGQLRELEAAAKLVFAMRNGGAS